MVDSIIAYGNASKHSIPRNILIVAFVFLLLFLALYLNFPEIAPPHSSLMLQSFDDDGTEYKEIAAPRSMPSLPYDEISDEHQYMIYGPAGGMSNQIMELYNGMVMAKKLNRTLYVPRIASHVNFVHGYAKLGYSHTFPADKLVDFTLLSQYVRVIPLNTTLSDFLNAFPFPVRNLKTDFKSYGATLRQIQNMEEKLVYFDGRYMYSSWFSDNDMKLAKHHVSYSPYLREISMSVAKQALGDKFYAIHGRLGDQAERWRKRTSMHFVQSERFQSWNLTNAWVYLASDNPEDRFFDALRKAVPKRVISLKDINSAELTAFSSLFDSPSVRSDMLGVLDKLICIQADDFLGTWFSTFTWDIQRQREDTKQLFPELYKP